MKGFAFVLLCALVAVQGRHTGIESTRSVASLGENPWVVHLRIAVDTSGLLNTCGGSLIDSRWALTAASCVVNVRYIWIRYGVVRVINPSLVTETSTALTNSDNNIALVSINRIVQPTENIRPIPLGGSGDSASFCGFSESNDAAGELLRCFKVSVVKEDGSFAVNSDEFTASRFDVGAPLVNDGAQIAILSEAGSEGNVGKFLEITEEYIDWIRDRTGITLNAEAVPDVAPEAVHFVQ